MSGFSFGTSPQQQQSSGFSQPNSVTSTTQTASGSTSTLGMSTFGTNSAHAASAFVQPLAAIAPTFGGGSSATAAPAFGAAGTATILGGATSSAPSFNFGNLGSSASSATASTSAAPAFSFGGLGGAITTATTMASNAPVIGLGGSALSFGKPSGSTTSASLSFGTTTTSVASGGLWKPTATTTAPFVGLGGVDVTAQQPKAGDLKQDVKVKETLVPDEIAKTVDALKSQIKSQKTISSEIGRTSTSKLSNVSNEINNIRWSLQEISNSVNTNYKQIKLLRKETSKTIQAVEMAQRTQDTPAGLQFENTAPFIFFQSLIAKYEQDLINFRQQIALTEQHMHAITHPQTISPDDLKRGFRQINESFISLAGRLHELHQKVEQQKEQYLNLRKYRLRDTTNVFATVDNLESKQETKNITCGPTPFSNISAMSAFGKSFSNASAAAAAASGSRKGATCGSK